MAETDRQDQQHKKPQPKMSKQLKYWCAAVLDPHKRALFRETMLAAEVWEKRAKDMARHTRVKTEEAVEEAVA